MIDPRNSIGPDDTPLDWRTYRGIYSSAFTMMDLLWKKLVDTARFEAEKWDEDEPGPVRIPDEDDVYLSLIAKHYPKVPKLREGDPQFWDVLGAVRHAVEDFAKSLGSKPGKFVSVEG